MLTQKLYKSGNSVAVTIPKEYLDELSLRDGSQVTVEKQGQKLVVTPKKKLAAGSVDAKFARMVDEFMDEHEDVLQELSQK
ncbi:AbrB/MazE/SpoVT family DNA-binding domain-containing protein [Candidatus Daviesbacteria bacterium]|nr:AbrB/MazE/SpoVT family DNA-binding domain-containing protein [Candidatus Daviesbacteria bacterium]